MSISIRPEHITGLLIAGEWYTFEEGSMTVDVGGYELFKDHTVLMELWFYVRTDTGSELTGPMSSIQMARLTSK